VALLRAFAAVAVAATFLTLSWAYPAWAQTGRELPAAAETPPAETADKVDEAEIERFAQATVRMMQIESNWRERLSEAPDEEALQRVGEEVHKEMKATIEAEGLTPERYRAIAELAQTDSDLHAAIDRHIRKQLGVR
jgi:hypothetical protein